jgi:hypothetical protein
MSGLFYFLNTQEVFCMNVDCTLNSFAVPGFSGLNPIFGTKKSAGDPISSREAHVNISMPFTLMRPHIVNESSTTTEVEVNSVFDITVAGITLELSEAAYNRCKAHIINSANGSVSILVNETETITMFSGEILDLDFSGGKWKRKSPKECLQMLDMFGFMPDDPAAASTANVDTVTGGLLTVDGVAVAAGDLVFLKNQDDPVQNGFWIVQTGSWSRSPSYAAGNSTAFTNKFIIPRQGGQKGKAFFLIEDDYTVGDTVLNFAESKFSLIPAPGKIPLYDRNGNSLPNDLHAGQIDGMGRDLRLVFGIASVDPAVYIPLIMAEIRRRCNNNGEIDNTGIPDFTGIEIGDYVDGLDLSGITAAPGGSAPQAWNDTYKNNRIVVSGFNIFKGTGDTETTKNHILFTFRNVICRGYMKSSNDNSGGYPATLMRTWLEGASGDGSGAFAAKLKTALGGAVNYLLTFRQLLSKKGDWTWVNTTVFLQSEHNVFGNEAWSEAGYADGLRVHFPIYQKASAYRVKRYNGARAWWWESAPDVAYSTAFAYVGSDGHASSGLAGVAGGGVSPAICVA